MGAPAPNAALLIDFDNVTMGMRSDLSKELKSLLNSDVIKGKVTVQRAYADWRRYPQYIVPLSENSVDLIFAPAYGSSKKNATDIRMAIDGMELIFTRPEIGTFILLTGDSDFSSLVLKLKEYGKYVIGVGIQESTSDILVQNCDEYYSYTSLAGLRKTSEIGSGAAMDPWVLVEKSLSQMVQRRDVMRSDRLKQVLVEMDPSFDEGSWGFSKFSKFLAEASSRGLVKLKKLDNGQYEVAPPSGRAASSKSEGSSSRSRKSDERKSDDRKSDDSRSRSRGRKPARKDEDRPRDVVADHGSDGGADGAEDPLRDAYLTLVAAVEKAAGAEKTPVRDSDVKRKILAIDAGFDETELGFPKFSRFLRQAHDHEVIDLRKAENGNYEVALRETSAGAAAAPRVGKSPPRTDSGTPVEAPADSGSSPVAEAPSSTPKPDAEAQAPEAERITQVFEPSGDRGSSGRLRPRMTRGRKGADDGPPPLLEGQILKPSTKASRDRDAQPADRDAAAPSAGSAAPTAPAATGGSFDAAALGLPTEGGAVTRYLTNRYKGVGGKTAEVLVEAFGADLFAVLQNDPKRALEVVPGARGEKVLAAWQDDYARRAASPESAPAVAQPDAERSVEPEVAQSAEAGVEQMDALSGQPDTGKPERSPLRRGTRRSR